MNKYCAYYAPDGAIRFKTTIIDNVSPPEVEGLAVLVLDNDFDPVTKRVVAGALVDAAPAPPTLALQQGLARITRNTRLATSDWTQASDSPLDSVKKAAWANYRDQLRNWPQSSGFPDLTTMPTPP